MENAVLNLRRLLMSYSYTIVETEWTAFKNLLTPVYYESRDRLATYQGDLFFVAKGIILQSNGTTVTRIIKSEQLLFVPLHSKTTHFQVLMNCELLLLARTDLYGFIECFPPAIRIYDSLLSLWYEQNDERLALLELQKMQRIIRFKELHKDVYPYMPRNRIASYISVSEEYLRKFM